MTTPFVHLHIHSEYSMVDSIVRVNTLIDNCVAMEMPAVAMTDMSNMYAVVKFYKAAIKQGIKPILGSHIWLHNEEDVNQPFKMLLFAQNQQGYKRICQLLSEAFINNQHLGKACVTAEQLLTNTDGVILVNDAEYGSISRAVEHSHLDVAEKLIKQYTQAFGDRFYIEIQRIGVESESIHGSLVSLAHQHEVPIIATNAVRFIKQSDYDLHEIRVCIGDGRLLDDKRRVKAYTNEQYLKSPEQMAELFADIPTAIENTYALAKRCNVVMELGRVCLPDFEIESGQEINAYLLEQAEIGLEKRLANETLPLTRDEAKTLVTDGKAAGFNKTVDGEVLSKEIYVARLKRELEVINNMGFAGYFLIVADFIQWSRNNDVPVGPGRGSGAGSLVAYCLWITDLDPMKYDLLFERFLNPERLSMPDFDIDFCQERREKVIQYVAKKYGREKVSQIITFGTLSAKAVVRDVGRVLGMGYGFVDSVSKLIPKDIGITIALAIEKEPELKQLYEDNEDVQGLLDKAMALEGIARNVGKHAGGVVIAPSELTDFTALYTEANSEDGVSHPVSHYDKNDIEDVGLVKFDFLGLKTLTIIDYAVKFANQQRRKQGLDDIVIENIPAGDKATYQLLCNAQTTAVFQLESSGMKKLIKKLQPDCFDDLIALVALYRPGPLEAGMVDSYVDRKHRREEPEYYHDVIEEILKPTYGVIIYQEQVMSIAQVMCGYTLGSADILRKAMGKKVPEIMAAERKGFVAGAVKNGIDENVADYLFGHIEKFAGYGFNKSHSACYALLGYQTAWLKANYTAAFMAANLSSDMDKTDKVVPLIADANDLGLSILLPNINQCFYMFTAINDKEIYYGLGAIKGVGKHIIEEIIAEREESGDFKDVFDLSLRVIQRTEGKINRRVLEALIYSGAFDCFRTPRAVMHANVSHALEFASQWHKSLAIGQSDLFSSGSSAPVSPEYLKGPKWSDDEQLKLEKNTLGLYLSGHPINTVRNEISQIVVASLNELEPSKSAQLICGLIMSVRTMTNKRGEKFAFIVLDDGRGRTEVSVFAKVYSRSAELLQVDNIVVVEGSLQEDEVSQAVQMRSDKITLLSEYRRMRLKGLIIATEKNHLTELLSNKQLQKIPFYVVADKTDTDQQQESNGYNPPSMVTPEQEVPVGAKLMIRYRANDISCDIMLNKRFEANYENVVHIENMFGAKQVKYVY